METFLQPFGQYACKAALVAAAYLAPCREAVVIMFLFWIADLCLGILASKNRQVPRTSRRLRKSARKLMGYMAVIVLAYLLDRLIAGMWIIPHRLMAAYLCVCELISILENLTIITQAPALVSLIRVIRGKGDENVIFDLIHEKNADYAARGLFGRLQSGSQAPVFTGDDGHADPDRTD